ncbi:response regulator transcription factor [Ponticaulis sp.]|uniref:response regulator transcription factor n=1 Tax=Ponticaulis sp. TaxID=2020902 RepID=UPI000C3AE3DC|nr:response regulator transcription factor [Ponticaulis sp.]MBN05212.1 DNA-binding response regulator [Ponticaulis sp.]
MRILIVEDNPALSTLLAERLGVRGINADLAANLEDADHLLHAGQYDAILLDLGLPDGDGLIWLAGQPDSRPPVLVLTARGTLHERVKGLDTGADDYLVKPAEAEEIAARLRAIRRRPGTRESVQLECGGLSLNPVTREVQFNLNPFKLGGKETEMLEILIRNCGRVIPRERIEAGIYGADEAVTPNALEAIASRLRKRLSDAGADGMLHTVRGVGYYLGNGSD